VGMVEAGLDAPARPFGRSGALVRAPTPSPSLAGRGVFREVLNLPLALAEAFAIVAAMSRFGFGLAGVLIAVAAPASAQELPVGQGEAEYRDWVADPGHRGQILSFEAWQQAAGVDHVLPSWQLVRTASMWRECNGPPFEVPPFRLWPGMVKTLRFIRDHVVPAVGPVEAVSGYRNPALNVCAHGSERSAHLDFFALDLVPLRPTTRRQLFERICPAHSRDGPEAGVGLGFYTFTRFHIDTRSFRRWGSAGPAGNESPCAVLERGGDPEAPPLPPPVAAPPVAPPVVPPMTPLPRPDPRVAVPEPQAGRAPPPMHVAPPSPPAPISVQQPQ